MVNISYSVGSTKDIPCKQHCEDRHPGCHDKCEQYISWKQAHVDKKRKILLTRKKQSDVVGFFRSMSLIEKRKRGKIK